MQLKHSCKCSTFVIILNLLSDILINIRGKDRMLEFSGIILQSTAFLIIYDNFKRNKYIRCDNVEYKLVIILILLQHVIENMKEILTKSLIFLFSSSLLFLNLPTYRNFSLIIPKQEIIRVLFNSWITKLPENCMIKLEIDIIKVIVALISVKYKINKVQRWKKMKRKKKTKMKVDIFSSVDH